MTEPLGKATVEVEADADEASFRREVKQAAELAEADLDDIGKKWGKILGESMGDELEDQGPGFARSVEAGLKGQRIRVKGVKFEVDRSGNIVRQWVSTVTEEIGEAFRDEGTSGIFTKLRMAVSDAIGAGFNISGRSPLIAFLVPVIGAIIALVIAALQAINGLAALLVTIPGLVVAAGIQIGVLMLAFEGLGTAISGAFAAENAKELNEALKDLTPSAQAFVRSLLPLEDFFKTLQRNVQEGFFKELGDLFGAPIGGGRGTSSPLGGLLESLKGIDQVAASLGKAFREIGIALGGPEFRMFIDQLLPATSKWLEGFGPAFGQFITGLGKFAGSKPVMDFLEDFGTTVNGLIADFGTFLFDLAGDQGFAQWLEDMRGTLSAVGEFLAAVGQTFVIILDQINKAGGEEFIRQLTEAIAALNAFLASDVGQKGIEGLMNATLFLTQALVGVFALIITISALFEKFGEIVNLVFRIVLTGLRGLAGDIIAFFIDLGRRIVDLFTGIPGQAFVMGQNVIRSFASGIWSMLSHLRNTVMNVLTFGLYNLLPHSPAKTGPLAGEGDPMLTGRRIMDQLAVGMASGLPQVRNVTSNAANTIAFGSGAINVNFMGQLPTPAQAQTTGASVGQGIIGLLNRDTALGVRSLAPAGAGY